MLNSSLVYPNLIYLGYIGEQIDPVPLSVCSLSLLLLLESETPREFKLDKWLNAHAECRFVSWQEREYLCWKTVFKNCSLVI